LRTILAHKQQAAEPLLQRVQIIALIRLAYLEMNVIHVIKQELRKTGVVLELVPERVRGDSHGVAGNLDNSAAKDLAFAQCNLASHETFISNCSVLNRLSIRGYADRRCHSAVYEVREVNPIVCVV
jgi:hypothetical protein